MAPFLSLLLLLFTTFPCPSHSRRHAPSLIPADLAALAALKASLTQIPGAASSSLSTWDFSSPDPCASFAGVVCAADRVTSLSLGNPLSDSPSLAGSLSPALANLSRLTQLLLYPGLVTGPIPPLLGALSNLRVLSLPHNRLTGPIPDSISNLTHLHTLDLSFNQLTGTIPPGIFSSKELKVVIFASNSLSGELPGEISAGLLHLDLKNNMLSGSLPLKMAPTLRYLSLSNNRMWGRLNGLEPLSGLEYLDLSVNQFNGSIPSALFRPSLSSLLLQRNNLSGGLPVTDSGVLSYPPGSTVDLSHNFLAGELSPLLAGVETLFLNNNRWIGKVPEDYVRGLSAGTIAALYLQHNFITEFPVGDGGPLPTTAALCLSYNCLSAVPPVGLAACPANAGGKVSRPESQCAAFNSRSTLQ